MNSSEYAQSQIERTRKEGMEIKEGKSNTRTEKILLKGRTIRRIILWVRDRLTNALVYCPGPTMSKLLIILVSAATTLCHLHRDPAQGKDEWKL